MTPIQQNGIPRASKITNLFPIIQSQWAVKIPNVLICVGTGNAYS